MNINDELISLKEKLDFIYSKLNVEDKKKRIDELTSISMSEDFWKDVDNANKIMEELNSLQKSISKINDLYNRVNNVKEMLDIVNDNEIPN